MDERDEVIDRKQFVGRDTTRDDALDTTEGHATTSGSAAGVITGGAIGMAAGPVGAVMGAVGGAITGAAAEKAMHGEQGHEHVEGDEAHYRGDHECAEVVCSHDHTHHADTS